MDGTFITGGCPRRGHSLQALKTAVKVGVLAELATLGAAYYGFHKLNTSSETREWASREHPWALEAFADSVAALGYDLPPDLAAFVRRRRSARRGGDREE